MVLSDASSQSSSRQTSTDSDDSDAVSSTSSSHSSKRRRSTRDPAWQEWSTHREDLGEEESDDVLHEHERRPKGASVRERAGRAGRSRRYLIFAKDDIDDIGSDHSTSSSEDTSSPMRRTPLPMAKAKNRHELVWVVFAIALFAGASIALVVFLSQDEKSPPQASAAVNSTTLSPSTTTLAASTKMESSSSASVSKSTSSKSTAATDETVSPSTTPDASASVASGVGYSTLVAFGASYTDNAHNRSAEYAESLRQDAPYSSYGGRYSNGPVAVEHMVDSSTSPALPKSAGTAAVQLVDYAYSGSVIENDLAGTSSSWPAAKDQITQYLSDVKNGDVSLGSGRVLHYFNSGINPVNQIWSNTLSNSITTVSTASAEQAISDNTAALAQAVRSITSDETLSSKAQAIDFLLVGIPPLEIVPTSPHQVPSTFSSDSEKTDALALLKSLTAQFNSEVSDFATALKKETSSDSRVWFFDLAALWTSIHASPSTFGITVNSITKTCYDSSSGAVCSDPEAHLYFDGLHPVTSAHKIVAEKINEAVKEY